MDIEAGVFLFVWVNEESQATAVFGLDPEPPGFSVIQFDLDTLPTVWVSEFQVTKQTNNQKTHKKKTVSLFGWSEEVFLN